MIPDVYVYPRSPKTSFGTTQLQKVPFHSDHRSSDRFNNGRTGLPGYIYIYIYQGVWTHLHQMEPSLDLGRNFQTHCRLHADGVGIVGTTASATEEDRRRPSIGDSWFA